MYKHQGPGRRWTDDELLTEMQRVARELDTFPELADTAFEAHTGIARQTVRRHFGSWEKACQLAELQAPRSRMSARDATLEDLFQNLQAVHEALGHSPRQQDMRGSRYKASVYLKRFDSRWNAVIEKYLRWREAGGRTEAQQEQRTPLLADISSPEPQRKRPPHQKVSSYHAREAVYGEPIHFRGLMHAPTNEQGVVFLFGMLSRELGFSVELVRSGFPDCEAKERIPRTKNYRRIQIEFEFASSHFHDHKHDSGLCDLVVCWEDDWPACPIPVLALKEAIKTLPPA